MPSPPGAASYGSQPHGSSEEQTFHLNPAAAPFFHGSGRSRNISGLDDIDEDEDQGFHMNPATVPYPGGDQHRGIPGHGGTNDDDNEAGSSNATTGPSYPVVPQQQLAPFDPYAPYESFDPNNAIGNWGFDPTWGPNTPIAVPQPIQMAQTPVNPRPVHLYTNGERNPWFDLTLTGFEDEMPPIPGGPMTQRGGRGRSLYHRPGRSSGHPGRGNPQDNGSRQDRGGRGNHRQSSGRGSQARGPAQGNIGLLGGTGHQGNGARGQPTTTGFGQTPRGLPVQQAPYQQVRGHSTQVPLAARGEWHGSDQVGRGPAGAGHAYYVWIPHDSHGHAPVPPAGSYQRPMYGPPLPPNFGNQNTHHVLGYQHPRSSTAWYTQPGSAYSQPIHGHPPPATGFQQQPTHGPQPQPVPGIHQQSAQQDQQQSTLRMQQQFTSGNLQQLAPDNQQHGQVYHQHFGQVHYYQANQYIQPQPHAHGFEVPGHPVGGPASQQPISNVTMSVPVHMAGGNVTGEGASAAAVEENNGHGAEAAENEGEGQAKEDEQEGAGRIMSEGFHGF
jgi:hypothetical protein